MKNYLLVLAFAFNIHAVNAQWQNINIPGGGAQKIAVKGDTVVASVNYSQWIFYSKAHGDNWFIADNSLSLSTLYSLVVSDSGIYIGGFDSTAMEGVLYHSPDVGLSWNSICTGCAGGNNFTSVAIKDSAIFAGMDTSDGSGLGVLLSTDNFSTNTVVNIGLESHDVRLLVINDTVIFAATAGGLFSSPDYGSSWALMNTSLTGITSLSFMGDKMFAGTDSGVYISTDEGVNWTPADTGLLNLDVRCLATSDSLLFAGTNGGGIFLSLDSGTSWRAANFGLSDSIATSLGVNGLYLFARTNGSVWRRQLSDFLIGINERNIGEEGLIISPNPVTSSCIIRLDEPVKNGEAAIYDMVGKEVMKKALSGSRTEMEMGGLPCGVYFVRVTAGDLRWVKKIVVQ